MTQVHTAPFLLVRPAQRFAEMSRLDARLRRCQAAFALIVGSALVLLVWEFLTARALGVPFAQ